MQLTLSFFSVMMEGEKPGGHSDRSVGIGTIEVAIWDAIAKIEEKPAFRSISDRYNPGGAKPKMFVYVGGGWYAPNKGIPELLDEMKSYLDMVKDNNYSRDNRQGLTTASIQRVQRVPVGFSKGADSEVLDADGMTDADY